MHGSIFPTNLRSTHAATCDRVILVICSLIFTTLLVEKSQFSRLKSLFLRGWISFFSILFCSSFIIYSISYQDFFKSYFKHFNCYLCYTLWYSLFTLALILINLRVRWGSWEKCFCINLKDKLGLSWAKLKLSLMI